MGKLDDAIDKFFPSAQAALMRHLGDRPLPAAILAKLAWMVGLENGNYWFWVCIRPDRDGRPPKLDVGEVVLTPDGDVVSVILTPEAEALRVSAAP